MKSNLINQNIPVCVIIPCYNSSLTLENSVDSIINQTVYPEEVILVNDCSSDLGKTNVAIKSSIIKLKKAKIKTQIISNKYNLGPGASRNRAWDLTNTKYIAFLDSDDTWKPKKLEIQYKIMIENNIDFSCHKTDYISNNYNIPHSQIKTMDNISLKKISLIKMFFKNHVHTRTVMLKNLKNFRFNEKLRYSEDLDLWIRILSNNYNIFYFDLGLAESNQLSHNYKGLSSNFLAFQKSELFVLFQNGIKSFWTFVLLIFILIFSLIKFVRRILFVKIRVKLNGW